MKTRFICKKNCFALIIFSVAFLLGILYLMDSTRNTVFMDYWRFITDLIPKIFNKTLGISDFFADSLGQKNPLMLFLVWFDIKFLNLNCLWESYGGLIINFLECIFLYKILNIKSDYKAFFFVPILLVSLSLNRWEIITAQFYLCFSLRIFLYIITFYLIDRYILSAEKVKIQKTIVIGFIIALEILFLSQLYFPALLASIFMVLAIYCLCGNNFKLTSVLPLLFGAGVGVTLYFFHNSSNSNNGGNFAAIIESIKNGKIFIAIFYMLVSTFFQQSFLEHWSYPCLCTVGIALISIIFLSLILFFKREKKGSFIPVFFIFYGGFQIIFIIYGRISYGIFYLTASRYTFDTALIWIGCSLILVKECYISKKYFKLVYTIILLVLSILLLHVNFLEMKTAKYRGAYKDSINDYVLEVGDGIAGGNLRLEDLDSEKLCLFQASPKLVYDGIKLLYKYKLNVFSDKKTNEIILDGRYPDNWIEKSVKIRFFNKTEETKILLFSFYNPSNLISGETIDISIDGTLVSSTPVKSGSWTVEVPIHQSQTGISTVEIKTDYSQKDTGGDTRELALILSDVKLE